MEYTKIEGQPNLIRDTNTNSIINMDSDDYSRYLQTIKLKQGERSKIETIESDLNNIKDEINEIKILLQKLINSYPTK
jgi:hypothetical protein